MRTETLVVALLALALISIPLTVTSRRLITTTRVSVRTEALARQWLRGSGYRLVSVDAEAADGSVQVLLVGDGPLPSIGRLEARARPLLAGRSLQIKVVEARSIRVGRAAP